MCVQTKGGVYEVKFAIQTDWHFFRFAPARPKLVMLPGGSI